MNETPKQLSDVSAREAAEQGKNTNLVAALITTGIWAGIGTIFGRMVGAIGDRTTTGPGKIVGMIIGGVTAGSIAFGTSLKIIGSEKEKYKDLRFLRYKDIPEQIPGMGSAPKDMPHLPENVVSQVTRSGAIMPAPSLDLARK